MILKGTTDNNVIRVENKTIQRISANIRINMPSGSLPAVPDLRKINLTVTLTRNKKPFVIYSDTLAPIAYESMYFAGVEALQNSGYAQKMSANDTLFPIMLDLGGCINVRKGDLLEIKAGVITGWLPVGADTTSSYIEIVEREQIGVETFIPRIQTRYIQAGVSKVSEALGDDVTSVAFVHLVPNTSSYSLNDANAIISSLQITSDRYNINDTIDRMISRRNTQFEYLSAANLRYRTFKLVPETEVDSLQIEAITVGSNIAASENVIVWRSHWYDNTTMQRAYDMEKKHSIRNEQKVTNKLAA